MFPSEELNAKIDQFIAEHKDVLATGEEMAQLQAWKDELSEHSYLPYDYVNRYNISELWIRRVIDEYNIPRCRGYCGRYRNGKVMYAYYEPDILPYLIKHVTRKAVKLAAAEKLLEEVFKANEHLIDDYERIIRKAKNDRT